MKQLNTSKITDALLKEREELQAQIKKDKARVDEINAIIKAEMKAQDTLKLALFGRQITLMIKRPYTLDTKRIKDEFPEIYDEYGRFGYSETLTIKKA